MTANRDVKIRIGHAADSREITVSLPDHEPNPWDLDSKLRVVGKHHAKVDAIQKVTGAAKYTHDLNLPGMLYGGFVRSPHARARVLDIDTSKAEALPGVAGVFPMAGRTVDFAGEHLVAIAAVDRQTLEEAISAVQVRYEVLPHAARIEQALADDAPSIRSNGEPNLQRARSRGTPAGFEEDLEAAEVRVETECRTQVQTHSCLETHGTVAKWDGDQLTVWTSTQATFGVQGQIAGALRVPSSKVRVLCEFMGGGFGSKFVAGYWSIAAAQLAKMTGRPVKIMLDRRSDQNGAGNRPDSIQKMVLGLEKSGKLGPYRVEIVGTPGIGRGASASNPMIYDFGKVDIIRAEVMTNAGAQQAFRAPGHPQGSFALETVLNLASEEIGMDPIAFREANDSHPLRKLQYRKAGDLLGWNRRVATGSQTGRFRRGFGIAGSRWHAGFGGPRAEVRCVIERDGSVAVRSGAQDIGVGTRTVLAIITAEELGLEVDHIATFIGDTNDPIGPGSGGSRTCASISPAVRQAAWLAGNELLALVAKKLGGKAEDYRFLPGRIVNTKDANTSIAFTEACRLIDDRIDVTGKRGRNFSTYAREVGGVQAAEVVVDCDLGVVKVEHLVAVQDCGTIINRTTTEGQVLGGVIQGLSYALFEERHMDRIRGQHLNADLEGYKVLGPVDMPKVTIDLMDSAYGANTTSVAGVGEPTMIPTASAVAGAIHNAIGKALTSLPLTPDKVLRALAEGGK